MPNMTDNATSPQGLWYRWRGYTVRWLLFGLVVSLFQPIVDDLDYLWEQKVNQGLGGLVFGLVCAALFTVIQNTFNRSRIQWKTWLFVFLTWLSVKVTLVSTMALTNGMNSG